MAQKAARQPRRSPITVDSGRPSRVPSISPFMSTAIARPRMSGRVSRTHIAIATPKNACEAVPVRTRAASMTPYEEAVAARMLPARKRANSTISARF